MSIRSKWCEYDKETRKYIHKRDKDCCVICGKRGALQIMHVFLSRAHGGKGCKENGCLGCVKCHNIIDNPIGNDLNALSKEYLDYCKKYLIEKEHITVNKTFMDSLKYKKSVDTLSPIMLFEPKKQFEDIKKCGNCKNLVKNKFGNSSIPTYYCTFKRQITGKKSKVCDNYREVK